jgi:protein involved in polysaccharide export with SLBB domain
MIENLWAEDPTSVPTSYPPAPDRESLLAEYRLRPLDTIRFEAHAEPELATVTQISKNGEIDLKLLNRIKVEGLTTYELKGKLEKLYAKYYTRPSIVVTVLIYAPRMIYLEGFVGRTGPVGVADAEMTLLQVLSASGLQPRGDRQNVRLSRVYKSVVDGKEKEEVRTFIIDYTKIARGFAPDLPLLEGDRIYIEDTFL